MRARLFVWLSACALLAGAGRLLAADSGKDDALKAAGLTRAGDGFVLADEGPVLDGVKSLRLTKAQADKESRARQVIETNLAAKRKAAKDIDKQWHDLEGRLSVVTNAETHNRMVIRMNRLVIDEKEAVDAQKDLEEKAHKASSVAKTKFVDDLVKLNASVDAALDKYKAAASDAGVRAALAKAGVKTPLAPSPEFTAAAAEVKKWQSEVDSEAIPLREEHGIHLVDVLLNGEHFMMGVDTGASSISLTAEVAEKLKIIPGEKDPTVHIQLADGSVIEGKEMTLKSVRVGRFTVDDVSCVVLQKGLPNAPLLLGGSFLNHFVVKMDPAANELHLTALKQDAPAKAAPPPIRPAALPKPGDDDR